MMKEKIQILNKTKFDYQSRRLGIIGIIVIIFTLFLGIPMITMLNNQNDVLTHEINKDNRTLDNLQLQVGEGKIMQDA